jgi:hypothetical protein
VPLHTLRGQRAGAAGPACRRSHPAFCGNAASMPATACGPFVPLHRVGRTGCVASRPVAKPLRSTETETETDGQRAAPLRGCRPPRPAWSGQVEAVAGIDLSSSTLRYLSRLPATWRLERGTRWRRLSADRQALLVRSGARPVVGPCPTAGARGVLRASAMSGGGWLGAASRRTPGAAAAIRWGARGGRFAVAVAGETTERWVVRGRPRVGQGNRRAAHPPTAGTGRSRKDVMQ